MDVFTADDYQNAALAAGYTINFNRAGEPYKWNGLAWRPLEAAVNAFELAIDANIDILLCDLKKQVICVSSLGDHGPFPYGDNKYHAVRRAIFTSAVALGAKMRAEQLEVASA